MSTQIVELTGDEAALLKSLDKVIQKQLEMERKWRDTAEQGDAAGVALQDALAKVQAESDKTLNGLLRELKTVGPEGSTAAAALRSHLQEAGKAGHRSMDDVLAQIRLIDPEAAAAAEQAAAAFAEAGEDVSVVWREQLQLLRSLGPEGSAVAAEIEQSMKAAAAEAAGGMEGVLAKLQEIDPTVAEAAAKVRTELAEAAQYSEREFAGVLEELRRLGPEGRQAAAELRSHLVDAGKIAEKSMGDIVSRLDDIDPASAAAARKIVADMQTAGKESVSVFDKSIVKVAEYAGSFLAVHTAVEGVRRLWEQVNEEQQKGLEALRGTEDADRRLLQISDTPEQFEATQKLADNLAVQFGVDRTAVRNSLFAGLSEGFAEIVPDIIAGATVVKPESASGVAGQAPKLFEAEGLGALEAISGTLVAAKRSRIDFEKLSSVLPIAAEGARTLGNSFAETSAAVSVTASDFGSANTAAERIKSFSVSASLDSELSGFKDLTDVVKALRDGTEERRKEFLGESIELNTAYSTLLKELPRIEAVEKEIVADLIATKAGAGLYRQQIEAANRSPRIVALQEERKARVSLEVAQGELRGAEGAIAETAKSRVEEQLLRDGDNIATRTVNSKIGEFATDAAVGAGAGAESAAGFGTFFARSLTNAISSSASALPGVGLLPWVRSAFGAGDNDQVALRRERDSQFSAGPAQNEVLLAQILDVQKQTLQTLQNVEASNDKTASNTVPKASEPVSVTPALSGVVP